VYGRIRIEMKRQERRATSSRQTGDVRVHPDEVITDGHHDIAGEWHPVAPEVRAALRAAMGDPEPSRPIWFVPVGHEHHLLGPCTLTLDNGTTWGVIDHLPASVPIGYHDLAPVDGGPVTRLIVHPTSCPPLPRTWGVAAQIYALWDEASWGIGDLGTLRRLAEAVAEQGGGAILTSPLHQAAPGFPQQDSPYYPSTRRAWSPLLLAIDAPPPAHLRVEPGQWIDRNLVWARKREHLWNRFAALPGPWPAPSAIALWNARRERFGADSGRWPAEADDRITMSAQFHDWMQTLVAEQLQAVADTGVSIIGDLAVGFAPGGADADEFAPLLAPGVRIGAPPDEFNHKGQDWGLPAFAPWRLRAALYQPFIDTLRAALRGVQGLRIDHVMGLFRQYWVPEDGSARNGAYVRFPADELLAIVCLEATRAGAFVIGEDLGTVEDGVREALAACGIAGTRVLLFEDEPPSAWPLECLATLTTHDLPTVAATWALPADDARRARLEAVAAGCTDVEHAVGAAHEALLASPAALRLLTTDDLAGATAQPNVPGTVGPPNWCRPLPHPVDDLL
jgi:4-alpha-glucanotransferase